MNRGLLKMVNIRGSSSFSKYEEEDKLIKYLFILFYLYNFSVPSLSFSLSLSLFTASTFY